MACEYCDGKLTNKPIINMPTLGLVVSIGVTPCDGKQVLKADINNIPCSLVGSVIFCPMCGERLGDDNERA